MRASIVRSFAALMGLLAAAWLIGCASLPPPEPRAPVTAFTDVAQTGLGRLAVKDVPDGATTLSGFRLLPEAAFAFDARISLARHAEKSLDVQYYLVQRDDIGLLFLRELREAAARGVRVRLLVDDLYTGGEDELFGTLAAFPNVEVRLFNPLPSRATSLGTRLLMSLTDFGRINHRMHNKMLIADNSFAVSGGRNIGNEYFMRSTAANFIDMDVISSGPIVRQMSEGFDRYWNSSHAWPIERIAPLRMAPEAAQRRFDEMARAAVPDVPIRQRDVLDKSPVGEQLITGKIDRYWARGTLFVDDPEKITRKAVDAYAGSVTEGALSVINAARREVTIASPYFIPGSRGMEEMRACIAKGGRITVVTNSLGATDEPLAYAGYERYRFLGQSDAEGPGAKLDKWCKGGALGWVLDNDADRVSLDAPFLGFDVTAVLDDPVTRGPILSYLFHRVESLLDGRRLVLAIDEFWKVLLDPGFRDLVNDKLKTIRKQNGLVILATQSPADALRSPIAHSIIEQCPTQILLPNARADAADYRDGLKLTEPEYLAVREDLTVGGRRFLLKQGSASVACELDLAGMDDLVAVLSGRASTVRLMERLIAEVGPNPAAWLPRFRREWRQASA